MAVAFLAKHLKRNEQERGELEGVISNWIAVDDSRHTAAMNRLAVTSDPDTAIAVETGRNGEDGRS